MTAIRHLGSKGWTLVAKVGKEAWIKNQYGANFFVPADDIQEVNIMKVKDVPAGMRFIYNGMEFTKLSATGLMSDRVDSNTIALKKGFSSISHFTSGPDIEVEVLDS